MLQRDEDVGWNLGSVSDDEQPQERTPRYSSLLTPIHLPFELSFDCMESVRVLPEHRGSVYTVSTVYECHMSVSNHLNLI